MSNEAAWRVATRQALIASGKAIVEVEAALVQLGYAAFMPMQERILEFAQTEEDVAAFQEFKRETAAEILSSVAFHGTHEIPGDGYASPYLDSIRRLGSAGQSMTLVGRWAQKHPDEVRPASMAAAERARQVIVKEGLRFDTGDRSFHHYPDVVDVIRETAVDQGATVPKRFPRPGDGRVLFAFPHGQDSIGFLLSRPSSIYHESIVLSWEPCLLRRNPEEAVRVRLGRQEDFAQPLRVDLAIRGFGVYQFCRSLGEVGNAVSAYIAAAREVVQRMHASTEA